jgi:hypothetical protein
MSWSLFRGGFISEQTQHVCHTCSTGYGRLFHYDCGFDTGMTEHLSLECETDPWL